MTDFVEYKRPLIVLLIFASIIFLATNFGGHIFSYENFVDQPYKCAPVTATANRMSCVKAGGYWKEDGNRPAGCDPACACCIPNAAFPLSVNYPAGVCPDDNTMYTLSDTKALYTVSQSVLPEAQDQARNADGSLTEVALKAQLDILTSKGVIKTAPPPTATQQEIYQYLQADEATLGAMQSEYCYYAIRYRYCIMKLVETNGAAVGGASASQTSAADWLSAARLLNTRLMDLVSIMKALTTTRMAAGPGPGADVAQLNADLSVRMQKLSEQSGDLSNDKSDNIVYKKMVEYTKQKAKANANLVLLYTFMNLIALGMLFYVYRAT